MVRIAQSIGYVGLLAMMGALGSGYDDMGDGMPEASVSVAMASRKQSKSGTVSKPKKSNTMLKVGIGAAIIAAIALIGGLFAYKKYTSNKAEKEKKEKDKKDKENKDKDPDDKGPDDKGPKDKGPKDKDPKGGDDKSGDAAASTADKGPESSKGKVIQPKAGTGEPSDAQKDPASTKPLQTRPSGAGPPPPTGLAGQEQHGQGDESKHRIAESKPLTISGQGGGPRTSDKLPDTAAAASGKNEVNGGGGGRSEVPVNPPPSNVPDNLASTSSSPSSALPTPLAPTIDPKQADYDKMSQADFVKGKQDKTIPVEAKQTVPA